MGHGTAFTLNQYNEVEIAVIRVLPKALEGMGPKVLINALQNKSETLGRMLQEDFKKIVSGNVSEWKIWRTIKLGNHKDADAFRKALEKAGCKISDWANDIMGKPAFTVVAKETEIDLMVASVAELGFKTGVKRDQIYRRAKGFGLEICPSEVGPQLRLQYKDQPNEEMLFIGMEPIVDSGGYPSMFRVERGGSDLWLGGNWGSPDFLWCPGHRWVFVCPRK